MIFVITFSQNFISDLKRIKDTNKILRELEMKYQNVFFFNPYDQICLLNSEKSKCKFFRDDLYNPIIADGSHLTNRESKLLTDIFSSWLFEKNLLK